MGNGHSYMEDEENMPKIKHQKCKICSHCLVFDYYGDGVGYWCWESDLWQTEANHRCHKWKWNGIDEK